MINKNLIKNLIKINLVLFWLFMCWFIGNHAHANKEYEYTNLDIIWDIKTDGTIDVKEDFTTYFYVQKHGIMREIPLNYTVNGYPFHIDIKNINVSWKKFTASTDKNIVSIKIWDANKYVYWTQNYPIFYSVYGLIRNFSWMWYAELYRNIVWNEFDTSINKVSAILYLPKVYTWFTSGDFLIAADGKSNKIEDFEWTLDRSQWDKIILTYNKKIPAGNWITISVKFPNNYFAFDDMRQGNLVWFVNSNTKSNNDNIWTPSFQVFFILFFIVPFLFSFILLLSKSSYFEYLLKKIPKRKSFNYFENLLKKVPKKKKIGNYRIITQFTPPEWISPSEISFLYSKRSKPNAISCMIYKRAIEWRILMTFKKWSFRIKDTVLLMWWKNDKVFWENFERECRKSLNWRYDKANLGFFLWKIWESYEEKLTTELPDNKFSNNLYKIHSIIQQSCENKWFIKLKQKKWKLLNIFIISIVMIISFILSSPILLYIWIIFLIILLGFSKPFKLTDKWQKILSEIYGYKYFLQACEEDQLRLFIKEDPDYIDKILPYATALWLETKLMDMVKPIYEETWRKITWYYDDFSSLSSTINTISSSVKYKSDSGFNSGSSFDSDSWSWGGGWSSGGWGWGGWWHSR